MCAVCGCGTASVEGQAEAGGRSAADHCHPNDAHEHARAHDHGDHHHGHSHPHDHDAHGHSHSHDDHDRHGSRPHGSGAAIDCGAGSAGLRAPGLTQERIVRIERDILSKNNSFARANRARFAASRQFALNFVSSPGSGKTTLLVRTIKALKDAFRST